MLETSLSDVEEDIIAQEVQQLVLHVQQEVLVQMVRLLLSIVLLVTTQKPRQVNVFSAQLVLNALIILPTQLVLLEPIP